VALFRKSEPAPAATAVVAYAPPPQPSAAPPATDLERQIRREIWSCMSPELAHAAQLSLAELIDWVSGATRLSPPQIDALGRKMGLLEDTPPTGIDTVRAHLRVTLKRYGANFSSHFEWRHGEQALRDFLDGGSLTHAQVEFLARALIGKDVSIDPVTAELRRPPVVSTPLSTLAYEPWRRGSSIPRLNELGLAHARKKVRELEAIVAAEQAP
jgi:hypothetical protein